MRKKRRDILFLIIYIIIGSLLGGILGNILSMIPHMDFMALGRENVFSVNFKPLFDINIIRFGFELSLGINIGSILGIILAIVIWSRRH